ncbi:LIM domain only protein 3-like [Uloborus diversus]|uniref:LIM domain only protein 3-like n=1 Tax=Uloborus diversus TaxID=327109 RepID=UPI00240A4D6F|nr:LIM domain only protein 3-like [Uloborus diversus]XP_054710489.1 LIM domain only protein 3-like [Uloborus diversus]
MDLKTDTQARPGMATVNAAGPLPCGGTANCAACQKPIRERFLLKALDQFWHEDCLKCACCDCRLGEVGSTLFTKANLILCKRDYLRLFGTTGLCSACNKTIPAFEMVMRARGNVYHLECFACQQCNHRFCVGDRFYLYDNKILCEYDYEERVLFASLPFTCSGLAQLKRQVSQQMTSETAVRDDGSSGYGSGDSPYDGR